MAVAALGVLTLATLPITGVSTYAQYADRAYALTDPQHVNPSGANQSSTGVLARLILPSATKVSTGKATQWVHLLATAFAVILIAATALVAWTRRRRRTDARPASDVEAASAGRPRGREPASFEELLGFGMVIAVSLVIGPFTWYHQFTWLLILLVTIGERLLTNRRRLLAVCLALLIVGVDANELLWTKLHDVSIDTGLYRALSLPFAAAMIAWAAATAMIVVGRRRGWTRLSVD